MIPAEVIASSLLNRYPRGVGARQPPEVLMPPYPLGVTRTSFGGARHRSVIRCGDLASPAVKAQQLAHWQRRELVG